MSDLADEVTRILKDATGGKGGGPWCLSSYQILDRLPAAMRDRLIADHGLGGQGTGRRHSAVSVVARAADSIDGVRTTYIDTGGLMFVVKGQEISPGAVVCKLFRLPDVGESS